MQQQPAKRRSSCGPVWLALVALLALAPLAHAATGGIDASYNFAWGNTAGWVNFAPVNSTVTVSDTALTGYAWSANSGWINLAPAQGGVTNSSGALGGFAWDSAIGWVSFSGVTIDASGRFHGQATGANDYVINFDCAKCDVRTTWRPAQSNTQTAVTSPGAISPIITSAPQTPTQPNPTATPAQPMTPIVIQPGFSPEPAQQPPSSGSAASGSGLTPISGAVINAGSSTPGSAMQSPVHATSSHLIETSTAKSGAFTWKGYALITGLAVGLLALLAVAVRFLLFL